MLLTRGRRQLGYAVFTDRLTGRVTEEDSMTCGHCDHTVWMKPFQDGSAMGGHCTCCDQFVCLACVGKGCTPMLKRIELAERWRQNSAEIFAPGFVERNLRKP